MGPNEDTDSISLQNNLEKSTSLYSTTLAAQVITSEEKNETSFNSTDFNQTLLFTNEQTAITHSESTKTKTTFLSKKPSFYSTTATKYKIPYTLSSNSNSIFINKKINCYFKILSQLVALIFMII